MNLCECGCGLMVRGKFSRGHNVRLYPARIAKPILCGVYAVLNTETGESYIGSSKNLVNRFNWHLEGFKKKNHEARKLLEAVQNYGLEVFSFVVLELCSQKDLFVKETEWLQANHSEYNLLYEASPNNIGLSMPQETRELMSKNSIGRPSPMKGRNQSESTRALVSASLLGNTRAVGGRGMKGKRHSEESIEKMRKFAKENLVNKQRDEIGRFK